MYNRSYIKDHPGVKRVVSANSRTYSTYDYMGTECSKHSTTREQICTNTDTYYRRDSSRTFIGCRGAIEFLVPMQRKRIECLRIFPDERRQNFHQSLHAYVLTYLYFALSLLSANTFPARVHVLPTMQRDSRANN